MWKNGSIFSEGTIIKRTLILLPGRFAIHRLPPSALLPPTVLASSFFSITRTASELSIVCPESISIPSSRVSVGWCGWRVAGALDFALTGILAGLSKTLADAGVSLFAVSTYDTDYIFVRAGQFAQAEDAFRRAGYSVETEEG